MTMGRRKGLSRVNIIILVALALLAVLSVLSYSIVTRVSLSLAHTSAATRAAATSLANVALTQSEIENALQTALPLQLKSTQNSCEISGPLECFQTSYTSSAGDLLTLLLARFSRPDGAVNFDIKMLAQEEQEGHAVPIEVPATVLNFRWLALGSTGGTPVYYGGTHENSIAAFITWGRTSAAISPDEAVQTFTRLFDAQIKKLG